MNSINFEMIRLKKPLEPPATLNLSDENIKSGLQFEIGQHVVKSQGSQIKSRTELPKFDTKMNFFG